MKFGFFTVAALLVGTVATHFLMENNGYVLINFRGYTVEMSVPILIFLLILTYLAVRLVVGIWRAPRQLGEIAARARAERSGRQITKGFIALSEGKLARGERLLTKGAAKSNAPLLNYLAAARTAQMQGDRNRRNGWLKIAYEQNTGSRNAVLLTQAELQLADGEYELAAASLHRIRETFPNHPQALKLSAELYFREGSWAELSELLPAVRRVGNVPAEQLDAWTIETFERVMAAENPDREEIEQHWQNLPRSLRKDVRMVRARIRALVACGDVRHAEQEIRKALRSEWDDRLVLLYSELKLGDPAAKLRQIESWLNKRPDDPVLLLTAGRGCISNQLWGKARSYLESSLAILPTPAAYHELGQLMLKLDDPQGATQAFSRGLTLSNTGTVEVPRLERDS